MSLFVRQRGGDPLGIVNELGERLRHAADDITLDGGVVLEEIDDMVVHVQGPLEILGVHRLARVAGNDEFQRRARGDVGHFPLGGRDHGGGERQLGVLAPNRLTPQVQFKGAEHEQHLGGVGLRAIDGERDLIVPVDPGEKLGRKFLLHRLQLGARLRLGIGEIGGLHRRRELVLRGRPNFQEFAPLEQIGEDEAV